MVPRRSFVENLLAVEFHRHRHPQAGGSYVECGTWAGGMSFAFMQCLRDIDEWHFFDSYQGLPPAQPIDGERAVNEQRRGELYHDNNSADREIFEANLARANTRGVATHVHQGWFEDTLPGFAPAQPISVLRLDGDWYRSTMTCLENLFHQVRPGGLILIDDYYDWQGCSLATHDFLSAGKRTECIHQAGRGLAYLIKRDQTQPADTGEETS